MTVTALLYHPVVYTGLLPLAVTLVACAVPGPAVAWKAAAGLLAAFLLSAWLAIGSGGMLAWDSTAKLVWAALPAFALAMMCGDRPPWRRALLGLFAVALPLWLVAPLFAREGADALVRYAYLPLFNVVVLLAFEHGRASSRTNLAALLALGIAVGLCAAVGASILYGERAFSLVAGVGALALRFVLGRDPGASRGVALAVALMLCTLAGLGTVYARVPAAVLVLLAGVPWAVRLPVPGGWNAAASLALPTAYGILPGLAAVAYTWHAAGPPAF